MDRDVIILYAGIAAVIAGLIIYDKKLKQVENAQSN